MNIPKTLETAVADIIRNFEIGGKTVLRVWHNLSYDTRWTPSVDRVMPCIEIRCTPPKTSDDRMVQSATVNILIASNTEDDKAHDYISATEEAVQLAVDTLYGQSCRRKGDYWDALKATFNEECDPVKIGGMKLTDTVSPFDNAGFNVVGMSLEFWFSRSDFS